MTLWDILLAIILTGVAIWIFTLVVGWIERGPIPQPLIKWGLEGIALLVLCIVVANIWGLHMPDAALGYHHAERIN